MKLKMTVSFDAPHDDDIRNVQGLIINSGGITHYSEATKFVNGTWNGNFDSALSILMTLASMNYVDSIYIEMNKS